MASQNLKTITFVELSPNAHAQLVQLANQKGMPIKTFAGKLIEEILALQTQDQIDQNPYINARAIFYQAELKQELYANARQIAAVYQENPTPENAEMLAAYCERANLDPENFVSSLPKYDPLASILENEIKGKSFKQAVVFLVDAFAKSNGEALASEDLVERAEKLGINHKTLIRAKAYINRSEESQIIAFKDGKSWFWKVENPQLPEPEPE